MNKGYIETIRASPIWKKNFKDIDDVLDNGLNKCEEIPATARLLRTIMRTGEIIRMKNEELLNELGLTLSQKNILDALFFSGKKGMTQEELSRFSDKSKANISSVINRMEIKGLISKQRDPENQRRNIVNIEKEGEKLLKRSLFRVGENAPEIDLDGESFNEFINTLTYIKNWYRAQDPSKKNVNQE